jgi:hypothetical protein
MNAKSGRGTMKSSWQNSGRFKSSQEQNKGTGSVMDVDRPPTYPQIGPVSKTGFGQKRKGT